MKRFGIIGKPLGHSFSPAYFTKKFASLGLQADYREFELPNIEAFLDLLDGEPELCGLNVTIPYKQQVIPYLNELSDEARELGAVNCISISHRPNGKLWLKGFNADIIGFMDSLRPLLQPYMQRALVLGTGGASRAVLGGLHKLGLATQSVSRSKRKGVLTYAELTPQIVADFPVIVNCTPVGMWPHVEQCPDLPYEAITPRHLLYDLIYNPDETLFLHRGRERGAATKNGLEMLHGQAEASWRFWNTPQTAPSANMTLTERDKMLAGGDYDWSDADLQQRWLRAKRLTRDLMLADPADREATHRILHQLLGSLGQGSYVAAPLHVDYGENIFIGDHVEINANCTLLDTNRITIGDYSGLAPNVQLYTVGHPVKPEERLTQGRPWWHASSAPITIGRNVWIGGGSIVLPGVTIGDGSTIGAGSVVTHDVPPRSLAVGCPAHIVRRL